MSYRLVQYIIKEDGTTEAVEDILEWGRLIKEIDARDGRTVAKTNMKGGLHVSTMFIPLDQADMMSMTSKVPILFETMVFARATKIRTRRQQVWEESCCRYPDIETARKGHAALCKIMRMNLWPHPKHSRTRIRKLTKAFYDRAKKIV